MGDIKDFVESDKVLRNKGKIREKEPDILSYILGIFLTFLPLFITVYIKAGVINQGYKITKLINEINELESKKATLSAKLLALENPKYLYEIAKQMGFETPSIEYIHFEK